MFVVSLAVGSCLALSIAVSVCHKLELMDEELDSLVDGFRILISKRSHTQKILGAGTGIRVEATSRSEEK